MMARDPRNLAHSRTVFNRLTDLMIKYLCLLNVTFDELKEIKGFEES